MKPQPVVKASTMIYRKDVLDFIYIYEDGHLTHVTIFLSSGSPSLNP